MKVNNKYLITLIIGILFFNVSKAQANLQFNQVKLVTTVDTVPAKKVWKVESVLYSNANKSSYITMNGTGLLVRLIDLVPWASMATDMIWEMKYPFWLPAGSTLAISTNVVYISVIEYDIVP
jgi:hypothetical protein